jgi:hypothetical protein
MPAAVFLAHNPFMRTTKAKNGSLYTLASASAAKGTTRVRGAVSSEVGSTNRKKSVPRARPSVYSQLKAGPGSCYE